MMNQLIAYMAKKPLFVDLVTLFVAIVGIGSLFLIQREAFPNVSFDVITVTTLMHGSSAEEVEKLVTNPIEQDLQEVGGIKTLTSKSLEGRSYIVAQLDPDQTDDVQGKIDIQDVIDRIKLPDGVERPIVTSVKSDQTPIIEVSLGGKMDHLELRDIARVFEKELERIPGVAKIVHQGLRDKEIRVEADLKSLAKYRLTLNDLIQALKGQNVTVSGGIIDVPKGEADAKERAIRTVGEFLSLEDVGNTIIRANETASSIRLKDVAKVRYDLERTDIIRRTNGLSSQGLIVLKKPKADAINVVEQVKARTAKVHELYGETLQVSFVNDLSSFIERRLNVLSGNLWVGLCLVLLLLGYILHWKIAILVALGIPFAFLGTLFFFQQADFSINLVSLLGLIIVSGMLVDDAIVVTDNALRWIQKGKGVTEAVVAATQEIWPAVTASVLTTVVAFLPMMFMSGIFGKFVRVIPIGVVAALLLSLLEAFFILPAHIAHRLNIGRLIQKTGAEATGYLGRGEKWWETVVVPKYVSILERCVQHRYWLSLGVLGLGVVTVLLFVFGMRFVLFPPDGIEIFFLRVQTNQGSSLEQTEALVLPLERIVATLPPNELKAYVTSVGIQQQDAHDQDTRRGNEYAQVAVHLTPPTERVRNVDEIIESLRPEVAKVPGFVRSTFELVRTGPPVGRPVSLSVRGKDYREILVAVDALKNALSGIKGVQDITDSYEPGKSEIVVKVDGPEAAAAGLSVAEIGTSVRAAYAGIEATPVREFDEEVQVRVSLPESARQTHEALHRLLIPNRFGQLIPLTQVSQFEEGKSLALYEHEGAEREVRVLGDVDVNVISATEANNMIRKILPKINEQLKGVKVYFGGEDEDTKESLASLVRAFVVAFMGIFLILIFTFGNLLQPMLVLLTIPLGMMSVVWALFLHGRPLSFMSMLGIIALGGVIVNNAIILIDFINSARAEGMDKMQSIIESARLRSRPIFLTTATTVCGLMPTAYGIGGRDDFVVPIALSLGWGLLFGSLLTAFVFPPAVALLDDFQALLARLASRKQKTG